jgi:hypothetical protein
MSSYRVRRDGMRYRKRMLTKMRMERKIKRTVVRRTTLIRNARRGGRNGHPSRAGG